MRYTKVNDVVRRGLLSSIRSLWNLSALHHIPYIVRHSCPLPSVLLTNATRLLSGDQEGVLMVP